MLFVGPYSHLPVGIARTFARRTVYKILRHFGADNAKIALAGAKAFSHGQRI